MAEGTIKLNGAPAQGQINGGGNGAQTESPAPKVDNYAEDLEAPYTDKRQVTISLVRNFSAYRKANLKVLGLKHEVIGSSVTSCRRLSSHKGEVEAYFPGLIGLSPTHPDFIGRVKAYFSNIQMNVNSENVTLDTSFYYNHKRDYIAISKKEDAINAEYEKVDRANTAAIKEALKKKIDALDDLESSKYLYGTPVNVEEYIMYRHCLLYRDVAKDIALINEDSTIRFYIKDDAKEAQKQKKLVNEKKHALKNFIELCNTVNDFNAVFVQVALIQGLILSEAVNKPKDEKESILMMFANESPDKFNRIVTDKNVVIKAFIETLIMRGELIRSEYNQQISTADGTFIGANMNEAVAYFTNPDNNSIRIAYENKLKLL